MKFKIDENLPTEACSLLIKAGHDALTVFDEHLIGCTDTDIISACKSENRALVTLDTDFCNILVYPPNDLPGIIVIHCKDQAKPSILVFIHTIIAILRSEPVAGKLWIVQKNGIRVRGPE